MRLKCDELTASDDLQLADRCVFLIAAEAEKLESLTLDMCSNALAVMLPLSLLPLHLHTLSVPLGNCPGVFVRAS